MRCAVCGQLAARVDIRSEAAVDDLRQLYGDALPPAIRGHDLDEAKASEAKKRAEEAMSNRTAEMEYAQAEVELAHAVAQLQAIQKLRKRKG